MKLTQNNSRYNTKDTIHEIFFPAKDKIKTIRRRAIIAKDTFDKMLLPRKCKELIKLNCKKKKIS